MSQKQSMVSRRSNVSNNRRTTKEKRPLKTGNDRSTTPVRSKSNNMATANGRVNNTTR